MSSFQFLNGTQIRYKGKTFYVSNHSKDNITLYCEDEKLEIKELRSTLISEFFLGNLEFEVSTRYQNSNSTSSIPLPEQLKIDLSDYPPHHVEIARYRYDAIAPLVLREERKTKELISNRYKELKDEAKKQGISLSIRSLYRWIKDFDSGGHDIRCLIPNVKRRGGPGKSRIKKEILNIVDTVIRENCLNREKISIHTVYCLCAAQIQQENEYRLDSQKLKMPSEATIARRIKLLDVNERIIGKMGKKKGINFIKQVGKYELPLLPLQRVEFDHTKVDVITYDEKDGLPFGRPTLSFCIDRIGMPLGYYLGYEAVSYYAVMECLYHSICPKPDVKNLYGTDHDWIAYGIPNTLVVDQGRELIGKDLSDACLSLGIVLDIAPVKTPEFKGGVERNFRTLNEQLFHTLPGTTFSNFLEKDDYNSEKTACLTLDEFEKALNIYIIDQYSEQYHRGCGGIPARQWERALETNFFPRLPPNEELLKILLGRVAYRNVNKYGIEFEGLKFNCQELAYLRLENRGRDKRIKIKYHPGDLSRIYAYNKYDNEYIEVPALDQEYTQNLSLWKHRNIKNFRKKYGDVEDPAGLGKAKIKIQQIVEKARSRAKLRGRSKIARWENSPPKRDKNENPSRIIPTSKTRSKGKSTPSPLSSITITSFDTDTSGWEIANSDLNTN
ncbi:Mu transposase C-terminal domain-containing protein [Leptolinea tardivitalis]|uniref:Integrase catalytic domain-containing protein n=1 Tax=Leptolinea tardivitalis TaxID=229920 RepID=A0A0P6XS87_9CHLR|nr:Mu transposase C-terminal domain-containing protein [Leptolinea tardivitalis]KPL72487.1 hypothetical protein ADM99_04950 [Leptolinea tardivitalis]GAP21231.1 mu transposase, C-terminal [Leptolinea tardivitalis]